MAHERKNVDVDDESLLYEQEGNHEFRLNAIKVFLTYAQCANLQWKDVLERLEEFGGGLEQYAISTEMHADGGRHIHVYAKWVKKVNLLNPRTLDVEGFHPNIRRVKDVLGCVEYVIKYGDYETSRLEIFQNSRNFCRKRLDHESWVQYKHYKYLKSPNYPVALPQGLGLITKPKAGEKRRHWWIMGPPNCGKTKWVNDTFKECKVYIRPAGVQYPFEGYVDEEIVIYDDVNMWDLLEELKAVTNTWNVGTHVYGPVRYHKQFWPIGKARTVIVLTNEKPQYYNMPAFLARFRIVEMEDPMNLRTPEVIYSDPEDTIERIAQLL